jgi:hypothetical protein
MPVRLMRSVYENLGYDLDAAVVDYQAAREAHKFTVDQPAPSPPSSLVETIVLNGGNYELVDDVPAVNRLPLPPPPPMPSLLAETPLINRLSPPEQPDVAYMNQIPRAALLAETPPIDLSEFTSPTISSRQFFHALFLEGKITQQEALRAVKAGELPAALVTYLGTLPVDQRFNVEMLLSGARNFRRNHPLITSLRDYFGQTDAQMDALFTTALGLK